MKNVFDFQIAAVMCVHNLSFADDAGAADRQTKLREVGVHAILHQVLSHWTGGQELDSILLTFQKSGIVV